MLFEKKLFKSGDIKTHIIIPFYLMDDYLVIQNN